MGNIDSLDQWAIKIIQWASDKFLLADEHGDTPNEGQDHQPSQHVFELGAQLNWSHLLWLDFSLTHNSSHLEVERLKSEDSLINKLGKK